MCFFRSLLFLLILNLCAFQSSATPLDYNGDQYSDPSTVVIGEQLGWFSIFNQGSTRTLRTFGEEGQHLVPGNYGGDETMPATLDSNGTWLLSDGRDESFGEDGSLYIAGADYDGDAITDLSYSTNACQNQRATFNVRLASDEDDREYRYGKGYYYKFYYDADSNGEDDFCTVLPIRANGAITNRFRAICKSVRTGRAVKRFNVGRVYSQPHPVKVANGEDLLLISRERRNDTVFRFLGSDGKIKKKTTISQKGTLVVGNFTSTDSEQAGIVVDQVGTIYDPLTEESFTINYPAGIPYDQINIVHFEENDSCFCTSRTIKRNGSCRVSGTTPSENNTPTVIEVPDNCSNPPEHLSSNDGFKCIASSTRGGSVVCLLPHQFTWKPHRSTTDHHNNTFACNKNDTRFDHVELVLESGQRIPLDYSGCHNYVATTDGPIGRQHFRSESTQWSSIRRKVRTIEMTKGNQKTCLSF